MSVKNLITEQRIVDIADAIRGATGTNDKMYLSQMPEMIKSAGGTTAGLIERDWWVRDMLGSEGRAGLITILEE